MTNITFSQIHRDGQIISETTAYKHFHESDFLNRYDSNLITWKHMPSIELFKEVEISLRNFHKQKNQKHLKFIFPPDEIISEDIHTYLIAKNYSIGYLELYSIKPSDFAARKNPEISVHFVTDKCIDDFLQLQFNEDLQFGESFAKEKQTFLRKQYTLENIHHIIAYNQETPVGSTIVIEKQDTAEIDNLFVIESEQHKSIGSTIQHFVMEHFRTKTIILVADGEDTPREMYQRQKYHLNGFQYEALKVEE